MVRTVIVGDIHGCYQEMRDLLEEVDLHPEDTLVVLGDTVVKGPASREVLEHLIDRPQTVCLLGNMEWRLLEAWREGSIDALPPAYQAAAESLGDDLDEFMGEIAHWPITHRVNGMVCVHAGVRPGRPLDEQSVHDMLHIREVRPAGGPACGGILRKPWYEHWRGPETIVFGHMPHPEPIVREHAICLDTGCVKGGSLSAMILPGREIVQVPAKRAHWTDDRALL